MAHDDQLTELLDSPTTRVTQYQLVAGRESARPGGRRTHPLGGHASSVARTETLFRLA
jgi:hypothetical protein